MGSKKIKGERKVNCLEYKKKNKENDPDHRSEVKEVGQELDVIKFVQTSKEKLTKMLLDEKKT